MKNPRLTMEKAKTIELVSEQSILTKKEKAYQKYRLRDKIEETRIKRLKEQLNSQLPTINPFKGAEKKGEQTAKVFDLSKQILVEKYKTNNHEGSKANSGRPSLLPDKDRENEESKNNKRVHKADRMNREWHRSLDQQSSYPLVRDPVEQLDMVRNDVLLKLKKTRIQSQLAMDKIKKCDELLKQRKMLDFEADNCFNSLQSHEAETKSSIEKKHYIGAKGEEGYHSNRVRKGRAKMTNLLSEGEFVKTIIIDRLVIQKPQKNDSLQVERRQSRGEPVRPSNQKEMPSVEFEPQGKPAPKPTKKETSDIKRDPLRSTRTKHHRTQEREEPFEPLHPHDSAFDILPDLPRRHLQTERPVREPRPTLVSHQYILLRAAKDSLLVPAKPTVEPISKGTGPQGPRSKKEGLVQVSDAGRRDSLRSWDDGNGPSFDYF